MEKMKKKLKNRIAELLFGKGYDNSLYRDEWVISKLQQLPEGKLLDAGAGEQPYKKFCSHLDYTSQDFCLYDGIGDGTGGQVGNWNVDSIDLRCDITDIPVENESFNYILCTEVFEHILNPEEAIKEFTRIIKPGGI